VATLPENVNLPALTAGVSALFGGLGLLTATGELGRLQRNDPELLTAAVILALLGSAMLVIAGLPVTAGRTEIFATLLGSGLITVGIGWAMTAGIRTAGERELPELTMAVDDKGVLDGTVKAGHLASDKRLALRVQGLKLSTDGKAWGETTIGQHYVGPDGDGKVLMTVKVRIPSGGYEAVGIRAWTGDTPVGCDTYPLPTAKTSEGAVRDTANTSCVVLPLPVAAPAAAKPVAPRVQLAWQGRAASSGRVRLTVTTPTAGKNVVVLAAARREGRTRQLLRTVGTAAEPGGYRATVSLRVGSRFRRICALAYFKDASGRFPSRLRQCPLDPALKAGKSGANLRRPARRR
jgi:hypothetical protein